MVHVPPEFVRRAHPYTGSSEPWQMAEALADDEPVSAHGRHRFGGRRFFHYLCTGFRDLRRTVEEDERDHRQNRFLAFAVTLGALWFAFWLF